MTILGGGYERIVQLCMIKKKNLLQILMVLNVSHTSKELYILLFFLSQEHISWENHFLVHAEAVPYASSWFCSPSPRKLFRVEVV